METVTHGSEGSIWKSTALRHAATATRQVLTLHLTVDNDLWMKTRGTAIPLPEPDTTLSFNTPAKGKISNITPAVAFSLPASGKNAVSVVVRRDTNSILDPIVAAFDNKGGLITTNDDYNVSTRDAQINRLPGNIDLTIVVYALSNEMSGDFTVQVSRGTALGKVGATAATKIYGGPSAGSQVVTAAAAGTPVEIIGRNANTTWLKVIVNGTEGWMDKSSLTTEEDLAGLPIATK